MWGAHISSNNAKLHTGIPVKIEKELRLKHCTDKRIKKEYLVSAPVTREFADFCREFGEVRIIEGLKKPFFTFLIPDCVNIKGILGETSIEVWYYPAFVSTGEHFLSSLLAGSEAGLQDDRLRKEHRQLLALVPEKR
jgi:hypothetical protein